MASFAWNNNLFDARIFKRSTPEEANVEWNIWQFSVSLNFSFEWVMVENAKQRLTDAKIGEKEKRDSAQKSLFNQCQLFFLPSATRPGEVFTKILWITRSPSQYIVWNWSFQLMFKDILGWGFVEFKLKFLKIALRQVFLS